MAGNSYIARTGIGTHEIVINRETVRCDGTTETFRFTPLHRGLCVLEIDRKIIQAYYRRTSESQYDIWFESYVFTVEVEDPAHHVLHQIGKHEGSAQEPLKVRAPMPGLVTAIEVAVGDVVKPGQGLLILEAMKMENEIRSPIHGTVMSIDIRDRSSVEKDQKLLTLARNSED